MFRNSGASVGIVLIIISIGYSQSAQCPTGHTGLVEHPTDCRKFLNCNNGYTYVQDCGPGTAFNPAFNNCDYPHNVPKCNQNSNNNEGNQGQQWNNGGYQGQNTNTNVPHQPNNNNNNHGNDQPENTYPEEEEEFPEDDDQAIDPTNFAQDIAYTIFGLMPGFGGGGGTGMEGSNRISPKQGLSRPGGLGRLGGIPRMGGMPRIPGRG